MSWFERVFGRFELRRKWVKGWKSWQWQPCSFLESKTTIMYEVAVWNTSSRILTANNPKQHHIIHATTCHSRERHWHRERLRPTSNWFAGDDWRFNSLAADDPDLNTDTSTYIWTSRSICDLFDVTSNQWVKEYRKKCLQSLNEEWSFYELLSNHDINAAGVEESEFCDYC